MKRTQTRHFPTNKRQPVSGMRPGDSRKMRDAWQESMKLERELLKYMLEIVKEVRKEFDERRI